MTSSDVPAKTEALWAGRPLGSWATDLAGSVMRTDMPARWTHALGALRLARTLEPVVGADVEVLAAAAVCHDLGYHPSLHRTGYPPLDLWAHLRQLGAPDRLANLCAHTIASRVEGDLRGHGVAYDPIPDEQTAVRDALWYCCLTVGTDGSRVRYSDRMSQARVRFADDPIVSQWMIDADEALVGATLRTEERMRALGLTEPTFGVGPGAPHTE